MREEFVNVWNSVFDQRGQTVGQQFNVGGEDMPKGNATTKATEVWIDEVGGFSQKFLDLRPTSKLDWRGGDPGLPDVVAKLANGYNVFVPSTAMQKLAEAWDAYLDAAVDEGPEQQPPTDEDVLVALLEGVSLLMAQLGALDTRVSELADQLASIDNTLARIVTAPSVPADANSSPESDDEDEDGVPVALDVEAYAVYVNGDSILYHHTPVMSILSCVHTGLDESVVEEMILDQLIRPIGVESGTLYVEKASLPYLTKVFQRRSMKEWRDLWVQQQALG